MLDWVLGMPIKHRQLHAAIEFRNPMVTNAKLCMHVGQIGRQGLWKHGNAVFLEKYPLDRNLMNTVWDALE